MTTASFSEYARLKGWSPSYVTKLKQAGRLVLTPDGSAVDVEASTRLIEETKDPNRDDVAARHARERADEGPLPDPVVDRISQSFTQARAIKEGYLARQAKLDYERSAGRVVEIDAVRAAGIDAGTVMRAAFDNLPDQVAPLLASLSDEHDVRLRLREAIDIVLNEVADRTQAVIAKLTEPPG